MEKTRCLLIEDDIIDQLAFRRFVAHEQLPYEYTIGGSLIDAKYLLSTQSFDIVIADYQLGDGTALDILELNLDCPVIITTGVGSEQIAVSAMKAGAYDYLIKDLQHNYLKVLPATVQKALRQKKAEERVRILSDRESEETVIVGASEKLAETRRLVELAATSDMPVLITGETGTGKNLMAKAIHYRGPARQEPFVSINCASLPETLIEAELFGYEKGAFTGASSPKKGLFELADRGTVFLDEIGEMPMHLQAKLLSVIEDKRTRRLGGEFVRPVNARVIASTNVEIEHALGKTFRKDLYYRLSVIRIHVPSLRERRQDIPELCHHLLRKMTGNRDILLPDEELSRLVTYDWPGNVRELKNVLERTVMLHRGAEPRPSEFLGKGSRIGPGAESAEVLPRDGSLITLNELEERYIKLALQRCSGSITRTAAALGISISTLKRRIKTFRSK